MALIQFYAWKKKLKVKSKVKSALLLHGEASFGFLQEKEALRMELTKTPYCRICNALFKNTGTSRESRKNLFKRNANRVSIQSRLARLDFFVYQELDKPNSICRRCESKLTTLENVNSVNQIRMGNSSS